MGGESKGLAGGNITSTNINTNMKNIRPGAAALSKVATVLSFDDCLDEETKGKTMSATASLRITGPEKQPKRGQNNKKLNEKGAFLTSSVVTNNQTKTAIVKSVSPPALQQKKSSPDKSEQVKKHK